MQAFMNIDFLLFVVVGFIAQIIDGALGMAYGVSCTSFLLSVGIPPSLASASVKVAEVFTTFVSGISHFRLGNVDKKLFTQLAVPGVLGGILGAYFLSNFPGNRLTFYLSLPAGDGPSHHYQGGKKSNDGTCQHGKLDLSAWFGWRCHGRCRRGRVGAHCHVHIGRAWQFCPDDNWVGKCIRVFSDACPGSHFFHIFNSHLLGRHHWDHAGRVDRCTICRNDSKKNQCKSADADCGAFDLFLEYPYHFGITTINSKIPWPSPSHTCLD